MLDGVNVALGVTGSIAAVKTVELAHELRREGANVRAVMSDAATNIVGPWSVQFATENDVVTQLTGRVEHVELCGRDGWADVLLIAPATANTVGKIAAGIDDTPVTTCATTALGAGIPTVVAPAMHEPMYDHPAVPEKLATLEEWGVETIDPRIEEGKAKIATEAAIVTGVARAAGEQPLAGQTVVVTAGGTTEQVDPVRALTNRSSGKTGRAVARACHVRGADVRLIHGDVLGDRPDTHYAETTWIESVDELQAATFDAVAENRRFSAANQNAPRSGDVDAADALISAAAISDYTLEASAEKIRSGEEELTLTLTPTPKLVDAVRERYPDLTLVGFKAETGGDDAALVEQARSLRERIDAAFIVANDASVMGADRTRALLVDADGSEPYEGEKAGLGLAVADRLAAALAA